MCAGHAGNGAFSSFTDGSFCAIRSAALSCLERSCHRRVIITVTLEQILMFLNLDSGEPLLPG